MQVPNLKILKQKIKSPLNKKKFKIQIKRFQELKIYPLFNRVIKNN